MWQDITWKLTDVIQTNTDVTHIQADTSPLIAGLIRNIAVSGYRMIRYDRARRFRGDKDSGVTSPDLSTKFTPVFRDIPQYLQASIATLP